MLQKFAGPLVGAPFCGAPVRPNMLNMPKYASASMTRWIISVVTRLSSRVIDYLRQRYEVKRCFLSMLGSAACLWLLVCCVIDLFRPSRE